MDQVHCKTNSTRNIRQTNGTLVLAAIHEKYLKKNFTAPLITTKRDFKYGRLEIRAALPSGKMLRPHIYMEPTEKGVIGLDMILKEERIDIMSNTQLQHFYYGIHFFSQSSKKDEYLGRMSNNSLLTDSLSNFHTYAMEWTETEISWMFDNKCLFTASVHKDFSKGVFDKPFKLTISLGVGGKQFFPRQTLTEQNALEWPCSLLILDYVRFFEKSTNINEKIYTRTE